MKKSFLFVLMVSVLLLSGCAPANGIAKGFVELPDDVKVRLTALVVAALAFFFSKLIERIPWLAFLEQYRLAISLFAAAEIINLIQVAVPDAFAAVAVLAIKLLLELLAVVIVFMELKKNGVRGFK